MMLPTLVQDQFISEHSLQLTLTLPKELFWFKGHFPIQAILPGVAQIDLVMFYAKQYFKLNTDSFKGMDVIKFQRPLFPEKTIILTIDWLPEKQKLKFQYSCENVTASSGQISL